MKENRELATTPRAKAKLAIAAVLRIVRIGEKLTMLGLALEVEPCSIEHMTAKFCFQIRVLNTHPHGAGVELDCQGVMDTPLLRTNIDQALQSARQIGHALDAEIQIFDASGTLEQVLPLQASTIRAASTPSTPSTPSNALLEGSRA